MITFDPIVAGQRVLRLAEPDNTPVEGKKGDFWARNHPVCCPQCGNVFYGFQPIDRPFEPGQNPSGLHGTDGSRQTCGHPVCADLEAKAAAEQKSWYRLAAAKTMRSA